MMYDSLNASGGDAMPLKIPNVDLLIQQFLRKRGFVVVSSSSPAEIEVARKRARREEKRVRFSSQLTTQTYENSNLDAENVWYQRHEYLGFSHDCRRQLLLLQTRKNAGGGSLKNTEDSSHICTRGLEDHLTPSLYLMKKKRKKALIRMVVCQHRLNMNRFPGGNMELETLRSISTMFSRQSRYWAHDMALLDARNR
jgi:hypothetical protein